jgi:hypothetical protein
MRGQAGDEHGGPPWFKAGVEPGRMARVVDAVGRRASSQSFPLRSGFVQVEFRQPSMPEKRLVSFWCFSITAGSLPLDCWPLTTGHCSRAITLSLHATRPTPHPAGTRVIGRTTRSDPASGVPPGRFRRRGSLEFNGKGMERRFSDSSGFCCTSLWSPGNRTRPADRRSRIGFVFLVDPAFVRRKSQCAKV